MTTRRQEAKNVSRQKVHSSTRKLNQLAMEFLPCGSPHYLFFALSAFFCLFQILFGFVIDKHPPPHHPTLPCLVHTSIPLSSIPLSSFRPHLYPPFVHTSILLSFLPLSSFLPYLYPPFVHTSILLSSIPLSSFRPYLYPLFVHTSILYCNMPYSRSYPSQDLSRSQLLSFLILSS